MGLPVCGVLCVLLASPGMAQQLAISTAEDTILAEAVIADHEVAGSDLQGAWTKLVSDLSAELPQRVGIDALHILGPADVYFSLDSDAVLGSVYCADEDVVHWNGTTMVVAWDASASGVPASANLDALEVLVLSPLALAFSLDVPADLPVVGRVTDSDIVRFALDSGFQGTVFDGPSAGVPPALDLDAITRHSLSEWLLSFDAPGKIGGVGFDDEDLLLWDAGDGSFDPVVWFDGSNHGVTASADLEAATDLSFIVADLGIRKSSPACYYLPESQVEYTIVVNNDGPHDVIGATVNDLFPDVLTNVEWTCNTGGSSGASCSPSGEGDIADTINLPAGESLTYSVTAQVLAAAGPGDLVNEATVTPPPGTTESTPDDNSSTHRDPLEMPIFCDTFETGDLSEWSTVAPEGH